MHPPSHRKNVICLSCGNVSFSVPPPSRKTSQLTFVGFHRQALIFIDLAWYSWILIDLPQNVCFSQVLLWIFIDFLDVHQFALIFMDVDWFLWLFIDFQGFLSFHWCSVLLFDCIDFVPNSTICNVFQRIPVASLTLIDRFASIYIFFHVHGFSSVFLDLYMCS